MSGAAGAVPGHVEVLFFASARELAGAARARLPMAGKTVEDLREQLGVMFGADFGHLLRTCALWVNASPPPAGLLLRPGDEVAVLPPVSGG